MSGACSPNPRRNTSCLCASSRPSSALLTRAATGARGNDAQNMATNLCRHTHTHTHTHARARAHTHTQHGDHTGPGQYGWGRHPPKLNDCCKPFVYDVRLARQLLLALHLLCKEGVVLAHSSAVQVKRVRAYQRINHPHWPTHCCGVSSATRGMRVMNRLWRQSLNSTSSSSKTDSLPQHAQQPRRRQHRQRHLRSCASRYACSHHQ